MDEDSNDKQHDHPGPWWLIALSLIALVLGLYALAITNNYRLDVIYDRVGELQQQLECAPSEAFVTDGVWYTECRR